MKKAIILDLDNTIYPVSSISSDLFAKVFEFIDSLADELGFDTVASVKDEMTRRPYQHVADQYNFSEAAKNKGADILKNLEYDKPMQPFGDYKHISDTQIEKYLVTTGFTKLQWSKVRLLGIEADFKAIYIVDPEKSKATKKDIFAHIMNENAYTPADLLIIGDDPESEIKAATALGIDTFLFDPEGKHIGAKVTHSSPSLKDAVILFT
ncbi:putative hydrolase of the HAD superfamily [Mucilaginibacter pineti]|uniref:Putative hydrolase of the HAD superfamily n=1 Tax=Mucilaginibacter pineti TaxID=1391627 RepID=A0A1G6UQ49_9SPHI|nr:HAD family hydrolase [Mucilaginibacter pineti]SDD42816.1 putative hydrolase of the HAD superfamily [Mucilaginibacter pineti]